MTMIMIDKAVVEQALAALVRSEVMHGQPNFDIQDKLREALAQPMTLNGNDIFQDTEGTIPVTAVSQQAGFVAQQLILPSSDGIFLEVPQAQQPVQEPLGFMNAGHVHEMQQGRLPYGYVYPKDGAGASVAVYTSQQAQPQQPLSEEEIQQLKLDCGYGYYSSYEVSAAFISGVKECEAAHGITKGNQ